MQRGDWCGPAVIWASEKGYMGGYGDGRFGPGAPVTREQLAAVLWRYSGSPDAHAENFADEADIASYAGKAVDWTRSTGVMNGMADGRFAPKNQTTRAQLAVVLANYISPTLLTEVSALDIMCQPCGVVAMADGSLLVTDTYNRLVWRVADGKSTICAGGDTVEDPYGQPVGGYHDAKLKESYFKLPRAIAPFLDGWAVSDAENNVVRLLRPEIIQTVNGRTEERLTVSKLGVEFRPTGLATDSRGNLCASDTLRGAVRKISPQGNVTTVASGLSEPMGLCWHEGALYVAESGANRVVKIAPAGLLVQGNTLYICDTFARKPRTAPGKRGRFLRGLPKEKSLEHSSGLFCGPFAGKGLNREASPGRP